MVFLVLGGLVLLAFLGGLRAFERASVRTIKSFVAWVVALAGLSLALLLVLTGREGVAIAAFTLLGPLIWDRWRAAHATPVGSASKPGSSKAGASNAGASNAGSWTDPGWSGGPMSRAEAYQVLGLQPGANEAAIRAAHRRLMRAAHPDSGGSDWVASRINAARDILLGPRS